MNGAEALVSPGHIFPLIAKEGGVLVRAGHTEASVDLAHLGGLLPSAVICEIMNPDGTMARMPDLIKIAEHHGLDIFTIKDLIAHRLKHENLVDHIAESVLPTDYGLFKIKAFRSKIDQAEHVALIYGDIGPEALVRVHSECLTGDVFSSLRCDCGGQLKQAMACIVKEGSGVLIYLRNQEGRGIGLANKINAYAMQDGGLDTVEANIALGFKADLRDYGIGAQILKALGIERLRLLTNNPKKIIGLEGYGLRISEVVPLITPSNVHNECYLDTKQNKMEHKLSL